MKPIEKLRQIWTPDREVEEITANLEPQTEMDSIIRDFFCRIVKLEAIEGRAITLDVTDPNEGNIRWEVTHHESGRIFATIWWEP